MAKGWGKTSNGFGAYGAWLEVFDVQKTYGILGELADAESNNTTDVWSRGNDVIRFEQDDCTRGQSLVGRQRRSRRKKFSG